MEEIWKPVVGWEGIYEVSNHGRCKRIKPANGATKGRLKKPIENNVNKYLHYSFWIKNKQYNLYVHRLVAQAFIPNPENKLEVNHKDFNKSNNHINNLEWVTRKENVVHCYKAGRHSPPPKGVRYAKKDKQSSFTN